MGAAIVNLRPYQNQAADFLFEHDRAMVLAPVGAGKTALTLTAIRDMIRDGHAKRALVIAPKRVCQTVWPVECPKWTPELTMSVAVGTPKQRKAALDADTHIVVSNYDTLQWLSTEKLKFDIIVFDELTRLKNPSGARFKALAKVIDQIPIRWGLTGSFTSNGLEDVFGQCKIIDQRLLGRSKGAFLQQYFFCLNQEYGQWEPRNGALEQVMAKIKPATFVLEPGDYKDKLPPLHVVEVKCEMDMTAYATMKRDFVVEFPDAQAVAVNAAVVTSKLQQIACIAHDTDVLTEDGWLPIQNITTQRVWDGVEWVAHDGLIFKGVQPVFACHSVRMTYNHKVLTVEGWKTASEIGLGATACRFDREKVRLPDSFREGGSDQAKMRAVAMPVRLRARGSSYESILTQLGTQTAQLRMPPQQYRAWHDRYAAFSHLVKHASKMFKHERQRLPQLRRSWDSRLRYVARKFYRVLAGHAVWLCRQFDFGSHQQRWAVLQSQLSMGDICTAGNKPSREHFYRYTGRACNVITSGACEGYADADFMRAIVPVQLAVGESIEYARTYDIVNAGPRNRFVVRGSDMEPLIVHNCGFVYGDKTKWISHHKFDRLDELLDENQHANTIIAYGYREELDELKRRYPQAKTLDDDNAVDNWNAGKIPLLLVHPKSAGHGLNLQHGGCHIVFLSLPWSLELYEQTVGRLHRGGQTRDVWCYVFLTTDTVDERIWSALHDKRSISDVALEALK